jgi:MFS family permease
LKNIKKINNNYKSIILALLCVAITGIGFGLSLPLLAFIMQKLGYSSFVIGLNTAMPALAAMLMAPLFVKSIERFGIKFLILCSAIIAIGSFWGFYFFQSLIIWFILRFIFGACLDSIFVASETWIAELASNKNRGKIMGIFSSFLSIGYFIGSGILTVSGTQGIYPFVICTIVLLFVLFPLLLAKENVPNVKKEEETPFLPIILASPVAMGAAFVYGYLETSAFNLLPIFAVNSGLTEKISVSLLIFVGLGQACLQYFIGAISDKFGEQRALILCLIVGVFGAVGIKLLIEETYFLYGVLFFWGACISGFYTLALIIAGKQFRGKSLAGANSAVVAMFGFGSLVGPPVVGVGMHFFGAKGFFLAIVVPLIAYALLLFKYKNIKINP